jgi:c-di-GMP phosphodiesterase
MLLSHLMGNVIKSMSDNVYIATQAILDRNEQIYAFELLFRSAAQIQSAQVFDNVKATSRVLVNAFNTFGLDALIGNKIGFVNVNEEMLHDAVIDLLPPQRFMLEILEFTAVDEKLLARIHELKECGYHFAIDDLVLDDKLLANFEPLFPLVDVLKIEVIDMDKSSLSAIVEKFKRFNIQLLAEKVEDKAMFERCKELGFDLFQGYYFAKPVLTKKKNIEPSQLSLSKIIAQITTNESPGVLEHTFKEAPVLSTALLRFLNSSAMNFRTEVSSIKHAINLIGSKKLMQWVVLISYAADGKNKKPEDNPLLRQVQLRAKMMECLTMHYKKKLNPDEAFMVGLLSLIDILFDIPLDEAVKSMKLSEQMSQAILEEKGLLGSLLKILRYIEAEDFLAVEKLSEEIGLTSETINEAQLVSLKWISEISQGM